MSQVRELHSKEAEQGVLGAVMLKALEKDLPAVDEILGAVTAADFFDDDNASLYEAIVGCHGEGMPVDPVTVGVYQARLPSGDSTLAYASEISSQVPSTANWKTYAQVVRERAVLRRVVAAGKAVASMANENRSVAEIIASAQQAVADLRDLQDGKPDYKRLSDVLPVVLNTMDDQVNDKAPPRLSTGLADLDKLIGFLRPRSMVVIAGRPGSGKTMLGLQIVQSVAVSGRGVGLIFSLEMGEEELTVRSIASLGGVDLRRMEDAKNLDQSEWDRITGAAGKINGAELYINDTPGLSMARIRGISRQFQRQHGLSILMVDYVGLIGTDGRASNRAEAVGKISIALKNLSKELGVPVLVLAQLNRNPAGRVGRRPQSSDLRDSGQIEQDADAVILVHHDPESEQGQNGVTELILDKGRQAEAGSCLVQRQGQYARFVNFAGRREVSQEEVEMGRSFAGRFKGRAER